jgi:cell division inhibitor SulA
MVIRVNSMKQGCIMNYLLEDIFRRADTWQGMGQHGMGPSGIGQQNRIFLHPDIAAANAETHIADGVRTGFDALDEQLYNRGWPSGGCIEVISDQCGLDAMGVFMPTMKALSGQERWQVLIDPPYIPYAPLLAREGIDLQEIMLVHPRNRDEALWAIEQALRSNTCSAVFAWLGATHYRYAELRKIQLAATSHGTLAVLFRSCEALEQASPASLKIQIDGYRQIKILKQRGGRQIRTIALPLDESLSAGSDVWASIESSDTLQHHSDFRPSA